MRGDRDGRHWQYDVAATRGADSALASDCRAQFGLPSTRRGCRICVTVRLPVRPRGETMYWQANANTPLSVTPHADVPDLKAHCWGGPTNGALVNRAFVPCQNRRRTNVQQLTCNIDLSCSFYYLFFSFVLLELKPFVLKGKIQKKFQKKSEKSVKYSEVILPFSCCPLVFL